MLILAGPMIKLALPGLLMVEAEFLAFEILTLASSYFGTTHLAAQSILSTLTALTFQIPFPISIAASTRVANLIGATLTDAAKTSAKVVSTISPAFFHPLTRYRQCSLPQSSESSTSSSSLPSGATFPNSSPTTKVSSTSSPLFFPSALHSNSSMLWQRTVMVCSEVSEGKRLEDG
jgi:hypothetical protein